MAKAKCCICFKWFNKRGHSVNMFSPNGAPVGNVCKECELTLQVAFQVKLNEMLSTSKKKRFDEKWEKVI